MNFGFLTFCVTLLQVIDLPPQALSSEVAAVYDFLSRTGLGLKWFQCLIQWSKHPPNCSAKLGSIISSFLCFSFQLNSMMSMNSSVF